MQRQGRVVGIVLEQKGTHKYINRIGEVWSASSPPLSGDALPSSPTQRKLSFTEGTTLSEGP